MISTHDTHPSELKSTALVLSVVVPVKNEIDVLCGAAEELQKLNGRPGIVELTLVGGENVDRDFVHKNLKETFNIRSLKIAIDRTRERLTLVPGLTEAKTPEDKWTTYIGTSDTNGLDPSILTEVGKWAIQEAKNVV